MFVCRPSHTCEPNDLSVAVAEIMEQCAFIKPQYLEYATPEVSIGSHFNIEMWDFWKTAFWCQTLHIGLHHLAQKIKQSGEVICPNLN